MRKIARAVAVVAMLILAACASRVVQREGAYVGIKSIRLQDKTDPILLRGTGAGFVTDLVETGLSGKGYNVCRESNCPADAVATVETLIFQTGQGGKLFWTGDIGVMSYSAVSFRFVLQKTQGGDVLVDFPMRSKKAVPLRDLATLCVQEVIREVPNAAR
jgi:hypothetical protein